MSSLKKNICLASYYLIKIFKIKTCGLAMVVNIVLHQLIPQSISNECRLENTSLNDDGYDLLSQIDKNKRFESVANKSSPPGLRQQAIDCSILSNCCICTVNIRIYLLHDLALRLISVCAVESSSKHVVELIIHNEVAAMNLSKISFALLAITLFASNCHPTCLINPFAEDSDYDSKLNSCSNSSNS